MSRHILRLRFITLSVALFATQGLADDTSSSDQLHPLVLSAQTLVEAAEFDEALTVLDPLISENPKNANALCLAGYVSKRLGQLAMAATYYAQALESVPNHERTLRFQGELYIELGRPLKAEANLTRLGEVCEESCEEYLELARAISAYEAGK